MLLESLCYFIERKGSREKGIPNLGRGILITCNIAATKSRHEAEAAVQKATKGFFRGPTTASIKRFNFTGRQRLPAATPLLSTLPLYTA